MMSRFVACVDLSMQYVQYGRSDSLVVDEAVFLALSSAASRKLRITSAEMANLYFQGQRVGKPLILVPPRDGLPGESVEGGVRMLVPLPIYGAKDAGASS